MVELKKDSFFSIVDNCIDFHVSSKSAGWWTDVKTGESIEKTRNRFEVLALAISELSEACYGFDNKINDDKLPQYPMYVVELGDSIIWMSDLVGAEIAVGNVNIDSIRNILKNSDIEDMLNDVEKIKDNKHQCLMSCVNKISFAIEDYRKTKTTKAVSAIIYAIAYIKAVAFKTSEYDIDVIISEKRKFNASREDHKLENRRKEGGKAH